MSLDPGTWSLGLLLVVFTVLGSVIVAAGTALTRKADQIATITGLSAALVGALLLGATTSLPGSILSISTALQGHPALAIGNAIGGIVAQTAFLALADLAYRRGNLEHAAASIATLMQAALLIALLTLPLIAMAQPPVTLWAIHPVSPLLVVAYLAGLRLIDQAERRPMWQPTPATAARDNEADAPALPERAPWRSLALLALLTAATGFALGQVGLALSARTGLSQTAIGAVFTAVVTSLPELITAIAAVRRGALQLAVGGIIGGNAYDVLFLAFSDAAYRDGSLYHAFDREHVMLIAVAALMTSILVLGMLKRERSGPAGIGFESLLILGVYAASLMHLLIKCT